MTGITIRPTGSISFADFDCHFEGCSCPNDCIFVPGSAADDARVVVDDTVDVDEKHGVWDVGVITFDAGQAPGTIEPTSCRHVPLLDFQERTCTPFMLATLPEPAGVAALLAGAALLLVPLRRRRAR